MKNSKRSDGGQYRLQLRNASGFDTATINVRVLDRPAPPQNLRADEFGGDALTLYWTPPKDNGGAEITNYVIEKREPRDQIWVKVCHFYDNIFLSFNFRYRYFQIFILLLQISSYVTTPFVRVRNLTVNQEYEFRVMAENQYGTSDPAMTKDPIKARHPFDTPGAPGAPRGVETTEDSITIAWTRPRSDGGSPIIGYVIEKRLFNEEKWTKATQAIVPDLQHRIGALIENRDYEFRVAAVNAAGQGPWSSSSDAIRASAPSCELFP